MTSDLDLLRQFTRENSQDAFAELVRRHVDLIYSAALRQVRSPQLAEEVAQSVFTDLARNADKISGTGVPPVSSLTPWLYAVTRRTAIDMVRKESRRRLREQIAVEMNNMNATSADWTQIEPLLDDAMAALDETDRSAVLLRYFENKSLREVGEALGASEDATQKRVSRAVERLREFFSKRNVTIGAGGLAVLISANAVQAAPIGLSAAISTALAGTAVHASTVIAATKAIAMTTLQKTLIAATLTAAIGTGIYEAHQAAQLQNQVQTLQQQQAPLAEQLRQLQRERDDATNRLASLADEVAAVKGNSLELLKLRGEATRWEKVSQLLARYEAAGGTLSQLEKQLALATKYPGPRWKGFLEQEALDSLARLKQIASLTPDQEQVIHDLLLKQADLQDQAMQEEFAGTQTQEGKDQFSQSNSNLNAQIEALLSPDQQAALETTRQRGMESFARVNADSEMYMLQNSVVISPEQEQQILPILYDFALKAREGNPTDPVDKANALAAILTPAQMEQYRKSVQNRSVRAVIEMDAPQ